MTNYTKAIEEIVRYVAYHGTTLTTEAMVRKATTQLNTLLNKRAIEEAEWWNSNIDFVAWEKRLAHLKAQQKDK